MVETGEKEKERRGITKEKKISDLHEKRRPSFLRPHPRDAAEARTDCCGDAEGVYNSKWALTSSWMQPRTVPEASLALASMLISPSAKKAMKEGTLGKSA